MTLMEPRSVTAGRRDKLVHAASQLIQRQGYARTTLAEIAQAGDIPPGSIYYYFKTKDEVVVAINDRRIKKLRQLLIDATELASPRERIEALIQIWVTDKEIDALYGCPIGSLCYELVKQRESLSVEAVKPLKFLLQWAEEQFRQLGFGKESPELALHLITVLQGASLVANAFNSPAIILQETNHLKVWIESLVRPRVSRGRKH